MPRISSELTQTIGATLSVLKVLRHRRGSGRLQPPINAGQFESACSGGAIRGFGVALKQRDRVTTDEVVVRIYVREKLARLRLRALSTLPRHADFGRAQPPVAIDIVELPDLPQLHTTCRAGTGIAADGAKGTLGGVVIDARGVRFGLTCAHVVAPWFRPNPFGQRVTLAIAGTEDTEILGAVEDWTTLSALGQNTADAALIRLDGGVSVDNALGAAPVLDDTPIAHLDLLVGGQTVRIRTRRGDISGQVDSIKNDLSFGFGGRDFAFSNIVAYRADVMAGDSGSSVVFGDRLLGLHFAGLGLTGPGYCVTGRKIREAFALRQLRLG
jgi:hypothetical protein